MNKNKAVAVCLLGATFSGEGALLAVAGVAKAERRLCRLGGF